MILTRVKGKVFSVSDLSCAYHQVPLSSETQKLTSLIIGGKQYTYTRGFYGLCGLPNFFSRRMTIHLEPLIRKKQAITYIVHIIMQSQNKNEMFTVVNEYHTLHTLLRKAGLKADPDKTFFFPKKVKFLGHVISPEGIQPIAKRVKDLKNLKSPESKRGVMKVLGCLGFYSCYIKNFHYTMCIDAKSASCWKYLPTDTHIHLPPVSTFQTNRNAVATGLSFINTLCTRSERNLPILMENNKNHQITLPKGRIGFSSLDVVDRDEPKYQIRSPYELTNAIIPTDKRHNDCFLLHSTVPSQSSDDFLQIIYGSEDSIIRQPNSMGHCISADARMSKGFADFLSHRVCGLRSTCRKARLFMGKVYPFWGSTGKRYIYNLLTKERFYEKPNPSTLSKTLEVMKIHASMNGVSAIAIHKLGCGLHQTNWQEVVKLLRDIFAYADVQIVVYTLEEIGVYALSAKGDADFYAHDEIERYSEEFFLENRELETDFTKDSKSCQPICDEQFPVLREKDHNNQLIDHYLQYQARELISYVKEFDFQYSDITDEEMILLIDMLVDARDVYSQHQFDMGKARQNFHVTLKPNVELKKQRPSKVPLHLKEKLEILLTQPKDADIFRKMGDDDEVGSLFVNTIILKPNNDYVKLVIDARYLNSVTDLTNYPGP